MKEAVGELNITVITVVAIAAIAALFYVFVWPMIQRSIVDRTCKTFGTEYSASRDYNSSNCIEMEDSDQPDGWYCCK